MRYVLALMLAAAPVLAATADDPHPILVLAKSKLENPNKPFVLVIQAKLKPNPYRQITCTKVRNASASKTLTSVHSSRFLKKRKSLLMAFDGPNVQ